MLKQGLGLSRGGSSVEQPVNTVISLDGVNDKVAILASNTPALFDHITSAVSKFTMCGWFKFGPDPEDNYDSWRYLFAKANFGNRDWSLSLTSGFGEHKFRILRQGGGFSISQTTGMNILDGLWHHYAITYDGSLGSGTYDKDRLKVYFDGSNIAVFEDGTGTVDAFTEVDYGFAIQSSSAGYLGNNGPAKFDEIFYVKFYKASDAEILDIYNKGVVGTSLSSVLSGETRGYWRVDKNDDSTTLNDHIGSADFPIQNAGSHILTPDHQRPSDE